MMRPLAILLALTTIATADSELQHDVESYVVGSPTGEWKGQSPAFAFYGEQVIRGPITEKTIYSLQLFHTARHPAESKAADEPTAQWIAADVVQMQTVCPKPPCSEDDLVPELHVIGLYETASSPPKLVALALTRVATGKQQAAALAKGIAPPALERHVDADAEDVVKLFQSSIGDPKALAKTVAARKDVVLFGSEAKEHYTGAKVAAMLASWNLKLAVRDGIAAGTTSGKRVAWVAANVDASPAKKAGKAQPYRAFFIYEKQKPEWKLVAASFSVVAGS